MIAFAARSINIHAVITYGEFFYFSLLCGSKQVAVFGFPNIAAGGANNVIVIFVAVGTFVFRNISAELMFYHQAAIKQQFNSVVERGAADAKIHINHGLVQGIHIEMAFRTVNMVEYGKSFRCFTMLMIREILHKLVFYLFSQLLTAIHSTKIFLFSIV